MIVGDYFKAEDVLLEFATQACELITWLRSKVAFLGKISELYKRSHGRAKTVIRAVLTRWTSHFLSFSRLLELRATINALVAEDDLFPADRKFIVTGDRPSREKAMAMLAIINNPVFWTSLVR